MNKNILLIGAIVIIAVVAVFTFANPDENPGTDTSGDHASETAQEHANENAAFNRGNEGQYGDACDSNDDCVAPLECVIDFLPPGTCQ